MLYAGGGVLSARATAELAALAEALEVPVAHTLMGKGCLHEDHPLLLGMTGFWGTPIANDKCRTADVILAIGTRLAEANSSSWDPRFTFAIPPTRLIHIDADARRDRPQLPDRAGRRRRRQAGARRARRSGAAAVTHRDRGSLRDEIARGRRAFAAELGPPVDVGSVPDAAGAHPERAAARRVPEDGFIVTDVGWNKNGVAQQFPITVPGTFITPSGLATMGFGPAAVLGVKMAQPDRAAVALDRRRRLRRQSVGRRDGDGGRPARGVAGDGQRRVRHDRRPRTDALRLEFGCLFERDGAAVPHRLRGDGAGLRRATAW